MIPIINDIFFLLTESFLFLPTVGTGLIRTEHRGILRQNVC